MTEPIYAIGDIHGQYDMLLDALTRIEADGGADARVIFLGDYVNRGPDSRQVLDRLISGQTAGKPWTCLFGNHEEVMLGFLADPGYHSSRNDTVITFLHPSAGGRETLRSYGIDVHPQRPDADIQAEAHETLPGDHIGFLDGLPRMYTTPDHIFVHAGIRPGIALPDQDPEDLVWIRKGFLDDDTDHGRIVVHGHTPVARPERHTNRINCDGGATFGRPILPVRLIGDRADLLTANGIEEL